MEQLAFGDKRLRDFNNPFKMWVYFLLKLPSVLWFGIRVVSVSREQGEVSVPFSWRSQNPFRSTYFAALSAAAELSTGLLASLAVGDRREMSMLITRFEMEYLKKATARVTFTCTAGPEIAAAVAKARASGEAVTIRVETRGRMADGQEVAVGWFTWSFRKRNS